MANQDPPRNSFCGLPQEFRDMIYEHVFAEQSNFSASMEELRRWSPHMTAPIEDDVFSRTCSFPPEPDPARQQVVHGQSIGCLLETPPTFDYFPSISTRSLCADHAASRVPIREGPQSRHRGQVLRSGIPFRPRHLLPI